MRAGRILGILLVFVIAGSGAVLAGEVVHFTNGTFMPIKSHAVENGMVRVVLTSDSEMAFPIGLVEKIDAGGRDIIINQLGSTASVVEGGARGGARGGAEGAAEAEAANENQRTYAVTGSTSPSGAAAANLTPQQRAQMAANGQGISSGFTQDTAARGGRPQAAHPFADSNHPGRRAVSKVGGLQQQNSAGAGGGARTKDISLRGASLQPGGRNPNRGDDQ